MLTLINFPRKQIGRTMSDCLTTGVLPSGVSDQEKRENTVYVKPFLGGNITLAMLEPGSKVGVLGEEGLVETNPRDLTWDEFVTMKFLVGKVLSVGTTPTPVAPAESDSVTPQASDKVDPAGQAIPIPLTVDFGAGEGHKSAHVYLRAGFISPQELVGRQVVAVVNVAAVPPVTASTEQQDDSTKTGTETAEEGDSGALVLTVGGKTTVEPAKEVQLGFHLA
jgi:hypothetical protein